ncbi:hypothetical protein CCACVL1_17128 [Corchorus capsularis]|uniref:Uncharacterized protein n=1 Tax=Corchorus capsularis TaxID=210143 RepID=A0A1R3HTW3_COCAP|nr:hypothetical protein CCACVL1_17128 [Corchorus capsularis]
MEPGTPKTPRSDTVPRIKPPPAMQSQSLEKPSFASSRATSMFLSCFGLGGTPRKGNKGKSKAKGYIK